MAARIEHYLPMPNLPGLVNNYYFSTRQDISTYFLTTKEDFDLTANNRVEAVYKITSSPFTRYAPTSPVGNSTRFGENSSAQVTDAWSISPTLMNEFHLGMIRAAQGWHDDDLGKGYPALLGLPNLTENAFPNINVSGTIPTSITTGTNAILSQLALIPSDTLTWVKGKHILKLGGDFYRWQVNQAWPNIDAGDFSFSGIYSRNPADPTSTGIGLADFMLGLPQTWSVNDPPTPGGRMWSLQLFGQDDYKLRPNLTLNLGLRYRIQPGWSDNLGRQADFDPTLLNPATNTLGAILYQGQLGRNTPQATAYHRGCVTHSYFNSSFTTVADALKTGNCTHIPKAMVWKVLPDQSRKRAGSVLYIDRDTREVSEVRGKVVILCAQALESVRILFNSSIREYPNGLANNSGVLGHYLMDHVFGVGVYGELSGFTDKPSINGPHRPDGIYVIRFRNTHNGPRSKGFLRGYGYQGGAGPGFNLWAPGFGKAYKKAVLDPMTAVSLGGFGECLPHWDNCVEIDKNTTDIYGIPTLRVHARLRENELAMAKDIVESGLEILEAAGARNLGSQPHPEPPGSAIHESGIARMGNDPKASVLNSFQQAHDIPNLFVMDGSGFPSSACQNPTLTIMALAVRSSDYLIEQMKRGNL